MSETFLILELTNRCNLDCAYCYNVWKSNAPADVKDLTLDEAQRIYNNLISTHTLQGVALAGGEPLLNDEIFSIAEMFRDAGVYVTITSNGLLLNEDTITRLAESGVRRFEISLPAFTEETYRTLCGSTDMKKVRKSILWIREREISCAISAVATRKNGGEIRSIIELAAGFGADHFVLNRFVPGGKGLEQTAALNPDRQMLQQIMEEANRASHDFNIPVLMAIPIEHCLFQTQHLTNLHFGTCICGQLKWVVDPFGNLRTCEQNPEILGNLLSEKFAELSVKSEVLKFRKANSFDHCADQSCYNVCGGSCRFAVTN